jgi:hypothetical protein
MYRLFVNGSLVLSDTVGNRDPLKVDSASGITQMLKGGDNCIAADVRMVEPSNIGVAIAFSAMIDTTDHFTSSIKLPKNLMPVETAPQEKIETPVPGAGRNKASAAKDSIRAAASDKKPADEKTRQPSYITQYRNTGELLMAIENYKSREAKLVKEIKSENFEVQRLRLEHESIDIKLKDIQAQIVLRKAQISSMAKGRGVAPLDTTVRPAPVEPVPKPDSSAKAPEPAPRKSSADTTATTGQGTVLKPAPEAAEKKAAPAPEPATKPPLDRTTVPAVKPANESPVDSLEF